MKWNHYYILSFFIPFFHFLFFSFFVFGLYLMLGSTEHYRGIHYIACADVSLKTLTLHRVLFNSISLLIIIALIKYFSKQKQLKPNLWLASAIFFCIHYLPHIITLPQLLHQLLINGIALEIRSLFIDEGVHTRKFIFFVMSISQQLMLLYIFSIILLRTLYQHKIIQVTIGSLLTILGLILMNHLSQFM